MENIGDLVGNTKVGKMRFRITLEGEYDIIAEHYPELDVIEPRLRVPLDYQRIDERIANEDPTFLFESTNTEKFELWATLDE